MVTRADIYIINYNCQFSVLSCHQDFMALFSLLYIICWQDSNMIYHSSCPSSFNMNMLGKLNTHFQF